jgi:hypothetical protein
MISIYRYDYRGDNLLNEPSLIVCNAIPTMGVLCRLTVGRDKIDQSRLKRIIVSCAL